MLEILILFHFTFDNEEADSGVGVAHRPRIKRPLDFLIGDLFADFERVHKFVVHAFPRADRLGGNLEGLSEVTVSSAQLRHLSSKHRMLLGVI